MKYKIVTDQDLTLPQVDARIFHRETTADEADVTSPITEDFQKKYNVIPAQYDGDTLINGDQETPVVYVTVGGQIFFFIPETQEELEEIINQFVNNSDCAPLDIEMASMSLSEVQTLTTTKAVQQGKPDHIAIDIDDDDDDDDHDDHDEVRITIHDDKETACYRRCLRQLASYFSTAPEAGLLSLPLAALTHQGLEQYASPLVRWLVAGGIVASGLCVGTWYKRNYYGKNLLERVDRMSPEEVKSCWQNIGPNMLCAFWGLFESGDGYLTGLSFLDGSKGTVAGIVLASAKYAKTIAVERPRVLAQSQPGEVSNTIYNISRFIQELAPPLLMVAHTKAALGLFLPATASVGVTVSSGLLLALTVGQAAAYYTTYYDGAEGSVYQGLSNPTEHSAAHASQTSSAYSPLSWFQTGDALPSAMRDALNKIGVTDSGKQETFIKWAMTIFQTVGLGSLYTKSALEFFKLNLPEIITRSGSLIEAGTAVFLFASAFCVSKAKYQTARDHEERLDPLQHTDLTYQRSMRKLLKCECGPCSESDRVRFGVLSSDEEVDKMEAGLTQQVSSSHPSAILMRKTSTEQ